ncbi:S26 family signal peptidase [Agromyces sp. Root81]|uniref:signal peptidase I n=1 Tax=Agromyces sp. Root81 TaxID=1736601 RepID=UPI0006FAA979|nr:signal peptidase I [Agromyces sp. Root81]KRC62697.1 S26 family signal peptidase [Agromyces sp. Root81]
MITDAQIAPAEEAPKRERPRDEPRTGGALRFLRDILVIFLVAVLVSFLIKTFVIRSFYIPSGSMSHTLEVDDRIIVNQLKPEVSPIERGDVVVFKDPGEWLPYRGEAPVQPPMAAAFDWLTAAVGVSAPDSDEHLVKRVIGLPGDRVVCCNGLGQMSVNGVPLREPYAIHSPDVTEASSVDFDVVVPEDSLWVMGDNREDSQDSRFHADTPTHGFVPIDDVVGAAFLVSWPLDRWAWLGNYPDVFDGVDPTR